MYQEINNPFQRNSGEKSRLHYYSSIFNTLEINSSFYKTPLFTTFQKWTLDVPENFRFSIKLSKEITHVKELQYDLSLIEKFMTPAAGTTNKKGCLLVQLPGKITLDYFTHVERILEELAIQDPENSWRKVIEFRHDSWYTGEAKELLNEYGAALVLHDINKGKNTDYLTNADFIYLRFHGPTGNYRDSYSDTFLRNKTTEIKQWVKEGKDVYVYFNNTLGSAYENALSLKKMLKC